MEYAISTHSNVGKNPTQYYNGIKTWQEVTDFLKNKLSQWTYKVYIYKYSSNNRLLGQRCVTMGNLVEIASSPNDKCLV